MSRLRALVAAAVTTVSLAVPLVVPAAADATDAGIPLAGAADLVAVPTSAPTHLVIAGSLPNQTATGHFGAVVTDLDGANPVTVPGLTHVTSLAVGPDGSTVYAASSDGVIAKFLADNPTSPAPVSTGTFGCPYDLAVASDGKVWFSYGCTANDVGIAVLDMATETITAVASGELAGGLQFPVQLDNAADAPDQMVATEIGGPAHLFSVSGTTETDGPALSTADLSAARLSPDASTVFVGFTTSVGVDAYTLGTGDPVYAGYYATGSTAERGVALSADGSYVGVVSPDTFKTFGPDGNGSLRTFTPTLPDRPALRGAVWAGHTLITMTYNNSTGQPSVHEHSDAVALPTSLAVSGPSSASIGHPVVLTGSLTARGAGVGGRTLTVTRTDGAGTVTVAHPVTTSSGSFRVTVAAPNGRYVTWKVSSPGDLTYQASSDTYTIFVTRTPTFLSIGTDHTVYYYNQVAKVTAHLGGTYQERHVAIYAQPAGKAKVRIAYGTVDRDGKLTAAMRVQRNTTFSAVFVGDLRNAPVSKAVLRKTGANPVETLVGYYSTDSEGYRLYHKHSYPKQHAHVDPNKSGQCVYFDLQDYVNGKWHDLGFTDCFPLNSYSNTDAYFDAPDYGVIGRKYRSGFYWAGDRVNVGTGSLWRYFKITA